MSNETEDNSPDLEEKTEKIEAVDPQAELKESLKKAQNDYLYLRAEFENYKKQMIKERSDLAKYASERILVEILNVMDNFDRALKADLSASTMQVFKKGMDLIANELRAVVQKFGVVEVPSENVAFNPEFHEALGTEESTTVPAGNITKVYKRAYKLHDRVIRPGQVIIAKEKSE